MVQRFEDKAGRGELLCDEKEVGKTVVLMQLVCSALEPPDADLNEDLEAGNSNQSTVRSASLSKI